MFFQVNAYYAYRLEHKDKPLRARRKGDMDYRKYLSADKSTQSKGGELAGVNTVLINVTNIQLYRCMVL